MNSVQDTARAVGCPIRRSRDQRSLASPPGFSQRATSFIASQCQGIHQMPFLNFSPHPTAKTTTRPEIARQSHGRIVPPSRIKSGITPGSSPGARVPRAGGKSSPRRLRPKAKPQSAQLFSRQLFSRQLFSRQLFSRQLFSRQLFSRQLFSRQLFSQRPHSQRSEFRPRSLHNSLFTLSISKTSITTRPSTPREPGPQSHQSASRRVFQVSDLRIQRSERRLGGPELPATADAIA